MKDATTLGEPVDRGFVTGSQGRRNISLQGRRNALDHEV